MFWSNQTLRKRLQSEGIISDFFDPNGIKFCAYELKLGDEAFLTSAEDGQKKVLDHRAQVVIQPGQFALLITKETLNIPEKVLAFISIKAGIKFRGLINVSGFHVDPGFKGKLKFSVYNAGAQNIVLSVDEPVFLIFFADLDSNADPAYDGQHQKQSSVTAKDVMEIQGKLASPAALDERIKKLEHLLDVIKALGVGLLLLVLGLFIKSCCPDGASSSGQIAVTNAPTVAVAQSNSPPPLPPRTNSETKGSNLPPALIPNSNTKSN
jgi:dCTP deaminase